MKPLLSIPICLLLLLFFQKGSAQDSSAIHKMVEEKFDAYISDIEKTEEQSVKYRKILIGTLDQDDRLDAVVEYGLGAEKGNKVVARKAVVYLNRSGELKKADDIDPDFCMQCERIRDKGLVVSILTSCLNPMVVSTVRYEWNGEEMVKKEG